jgi:DNA-binding transcriptional MocR family regulator
MFLFIELSPLPDGTKLDSYTFIKERAFKGGVLCVPGGAFMPLGMTSSFIRASFSLADEQTANEAFRRLRVCIDDLRAEHA